MVGHLYARWRFTAHVSCHSNLDSKPKWITLRELCVKVTSFQVKVGVTADECKHFCELDKRCVMVKYSEERSKCWLSEYRNMGGKKRCDEYFDFYVQGEQSSAIHVMKWIHWIGTTCLIKQVNMTRKFVISYKTFDVSSYL